MSADPCRQPGLLPLDEARAQLLDAVVPLQQSQVLALERACGRVLAEDACAQVSLPPCDNAAMDGYALCGDGECFRLVGQALAGHPFAGTLESGQCVRVATGAALPAGAERVVMQERVACKGGHIRVLKLPAMGANIRRRGEDVGGGECLAVRGRQLKVPDIALLAAAGVRQVTVLRRLRVALLSVGDELRPLHTPAAALDTGDIYDSNGIALRAALGELDVDVIDLGCQPDDPGRVRQALETARDCADMVITSGGVSVGVADHTGRVLRELGQLQRWRLAIKPGKPFAFARLRHATGTTPCFSLPGNPVAALVTFYQLVLPALEKLRGGSMDPPMQWRARLLSAVRKSPGRLDFQRGFTYCNDAGVQVVATAGVQGSHILSGLAGANCFIVLPQDSGDCAPGDWVTVEPFRKPLA